jgi:hypothetical protein
MLSYLLFKPPFITETGNHEQLQTLEDGIITILDGSQFIVFKAQNYPGRKTYWELSWSHEFEVTK